MHSDSHLGTGESLSYGATASIRGTGYHKGSVFGWSPRCMLLRKPVKDKLQAFKESNQNKLQHFQAQMLLGGHKDTVLFHLI